MNKKTMLIVGIFAISVIAFSAHTDTGNADVSALPSTVKIGFLYPATGGLGAISQGLLDGANAAIERLNTEFSSVTWKLVSQDTATDATTGKTAAQTLVSDGVKVIVGAAASGVSLAASEVTILNKVPQVSYASTSPAITDLGDDDYLFRVVASDLFQGQALAQLAKDKGVTKAFVLNLDNAYGNGVEAEFTKKFTALGGTVVNTIAYDENAASFSTEVTQVKNSNADGVIIVAYPKDANKIFAEANTQSVNLNWFGTDGIASSSVTNNTGTRDYLTGRLFGTTPSSGTNPGSSSKYQQYLDDLQTTSGSTGIFGDYAYDAVYLAGSAVSAAGEYDGVKIRDALYSTASGFAGATGADKAFNCDGEPLSQAYDYWNSTAFAVTTEKARASEFSGLGTAATSPCGNHPYNKTSSGASSPGFELIFLLSAIITVVVTRKKKLS